MSGLLLELLGMKPPNGSRPGVRPGECPYCGSLRIIVDKKDGFFPRYGCLICDRWFGNPQLDGSPTIRRR
jgi:hypothetical protein